MPLSPEDVVSKRFNPTRVREGYAQDEVDDFLDEVVAELRRLTSENDGLRAELAQAQQRVGELTRAASAADSGAPVDFAKPEPVVEARPEPEPVAAPAVVEHSPADQAAGVIALAQRLHDEYVREGESRRDALLAEAEEQAQRVVAEAEVRRERTLGDLESRRHQLEDVIRQLHGRESTYREQLEHFMAGQLEDLRRAERVVPDEAVSR